MLLLPRIAYLQCIHVYTVYNCIQKQIEIVWRLPIHAWIKFNLHSDSEVFCSQTTREKRREEKRREEKNPGAGVCVDRMNWAPEGAAAGRGPSGSFVHTNASDGDRAQAFASQRDIFPFAHRTK